MKIILILIIAILIYIIYQFYKENEELLEENFELEIELDNKRKLLKHIAYRCSENAGKQWHGNSAKGFRDIEELAKSKTLDSDYQSKI